MLLPEPMEPQAEPAARAREPVAPCPPVAARETARAFEAVKQAARRRRVVQAVLLSVSLLLLGGGGLAYYLRTTLAARDTCAGEWRVWGHCMQTTELFDGEAAFQRFCSAHSDLVGVCIRKKTCEEFRACVRSTVEHWRKQAVDRERAVAPTLGTPPRESVGTPPLQ